MACAAQGFRRMNPFCIPFAITNMAGALLAMDLGFMGPNYSISTACATGNYCLLRCAARTCLLPQAQLPRSFHACCRLGYWCRKECSTLPLQIIY
jgi:hypothetical protein